MQTVPSPWSPSHLPAGSAPHSPGSVRGVGTRGILEGAQTLGWQDRMAGASGPVPSSVPRASPHSAGMEWRGQRCPTPRMGGQRRFTGEVAPMGEGLPSGSPLPHWRLRVALSQPSRGKAGCWQCPGKFGVPGKEWGPWGLLQGREVPRGLAWPGLGGSSFHEAHSPVSQPLP